MHELRNHLFMRIGMLSAYFRPRIPKRFSSQVSVDDMVQETLLAAIRSAEQFSGNYADHLDRWLSRIAQRRLMDRVRKLRAMKRGGDASSRPVDRMTSLTEILNQIEACDRTPSRAAAATEAQHAVGVILEALPSDWCKAITLRFMHGLTESEIAASMGRSTSAVRGMIYRGLRALRMELGAAKKYLSGASSSDEQP